MVPPVLYIEEYPEQQRIINQLTNHIFSRAVVLLEVKLRDFITSLKIVFLILSFCVFFVVVSFAFKDFSYILSSIIFRKFLHIYMFSLDKRFAKYFGYFGRKSCCVLGTFHDKDF